VSLRAELDGAGALLAAAGIRTQIDVALPGPGPAVDEALGWVLREAVTNVLRHSEATEVGIRADRAGGRVHLEIVNDGARGTGDAGSGLAGLADRVRPLGGVVDGRRAPGGRFRLTVELPEETS
jgi:two-component system sensor histidine kinase DesK